MYAVENFTRVDSQQAKTHTSHITYIIDVLESLKRDLGVVFNHVGNDGV